MQKLHQIDALQQEGNYKVKKTGEQHTCAHCQTEFVGYVCPQCGMRADSEHFTAIVVLHKMMDSVGFDERGNNSILRTISDLFWRPGYMIRDYLGGHSAAYFQPFKFLLLLVIAFTLLIHLTGVETDGIVDISDFTKKAENDEVLKVILPLVEIGRDIVQWFRNNIAWSMILQNIFIVNAMWIVYHKRVPYTWTENFIAQMYISCQFMIIAIVQLLLTWRYEPSGLFPYFVSYWVIAIVIIYDFYQLYGERRLLPAVWRVIKIVIWLIIQYSVIVLLILTVICVFFAITAPESIIHKE